MATEDVGGTGRGEGWWPVAPAFLLALLAILIIGAPGRIDRRGPRA